MTEPEVYKIISDGTTRLDLLIANKISKLSRSAAKKLIISGNVLCQNQIYTDCKPVLKGTELTVNYFKADENQGVMPENIPLNIIYEDSDLIIINKPKGMSVHTGSGIDGGTLVNALLYRYKSLSTLNGDFRPGIVHRLDKDTTGLLVVAKTNQAHVNLAEQIKEKSCKRYYLALVDGVIEKDSGIIKTKFGRHPKNRVKMSVLESGRDAETHFKVLKRFSQHTLCEFELKTGRTHQIRVHAKYLGHPVTGDKVYGTGNKRYKQNGQFLHAYKLTLKSPSSGKILEFEAPMPEYFEAVINTLE